uniref:Putative microtubule associated protein n=1 Tax=Anopheles triannulatus TaxID=58253 RepID=A0A2M4ALN7_9DIPT
MDEDEAMASAQPDPVIGAVKIIAQEPSAAPKVIRPKGPFKLDENVIAEIERNWVRADDLGKTVLNPMDDSFIYDDLKVIPVNGVSYPPEKFQQLITRNHLATGGAGGPGSSPVHIHHTVGSGTVNRSSLVEGSGILAATKTKSSPAVVPSITDELPKVLDQNLMRIIRGIANNDMYAAHAAINELTDIMQLPEKQAVLRGYEEIYLQSVLQQFKNIQQKPLSESMSIYQPLLQSMYLFFTSKSLGKHLSITTIKSIMTVLLGLMADNRLQTGNDDVQFVKVLNGICMKILDRTNFTYVNCALIRLLKESCQTSCLPKFTDLQMKCIWRNVKMIPDRVAELDYEPVLLEVHEFMLLLPHSWWQGRPSDMPLRTVKTIVHNLTKIKGNSILQHLNTIPTHSELHSYVLRILKNINKESGTGTTRATAAASAAGTGVTVQQNVQNSDNNNHGPRSMVMGGGGDGNGDATGGAEYQKYITPEPTTAGAEGGTQNKQNPEYWMDKLSTMLKKSTVNSGQHHPHLRGTSGMLVGATGTQSQSMDGSPTGVSVTSGSSITDENLNLNQMHAAKFGLRRGLDEGVYTGTPLSSTGTTSQRRELLQQKLEQLKQHK